MAQQAGTLDRIFNSTISLPQQVAWRLYRAWEDEDIDLFSEKGIWDGALIPGFGVFDSHEHDVMPDYMAKQVGFKDNWLGHLGAAIIFDPITYASGGLTAAGRAGKAAVKASSGPTLKNVLRSTATENKTSLDSFMKGLDAHQLETRPRD